MPARPKAIDVASRRGQALVDAVVREVEEGRRQHALSLETLGAAVGMSRWQVARIVRGEDRGVTILELSRLLAAVGLRLSVRAYPDGEPVRDGPHLALLRAFRARLHPSLAWRTEVPLPVGGDRRAWDALIGGPGWSCGVEAETRIRDLQAVERKIALKLRDAGIERAVLVLADTRHHRSLLRTWPEIAASFPIPGARAVALLAAGADPGGSSIVLVRARAVHKPTTQRGS